MQKIFLIFVLTITVISGFAQTNKDELQRKRQQLKKEIEETQKALVETQKTTKENMGQLSLINKKIDLQGNVIDNISGELKYLENDIYKSQLEVNKLSRVIDTLKQEYGKSMVYAYKNRNNYDFLNFIFSAGNFNDAIKRITYLKSYRNHRELQEENIMHTQHLLQDRISQLSGKKKEKNNVLQEKSTEMNVMEKQQQEKENLVAKLKSKQQELSKQLTVKRRQDNKLRTAIDVMIRKEIELARKKAEEERRAREKELAAEKAKAAANNNNTVTPTTPARTRPLREVKKTESVLVSSDADRLLDASFERNRGHLPWPATGFIINHFGPNEYPGGIKYINPKVDIGTKVGEPVKAVFDGDITLVKDLENGQAVFIKHGKYFTVYSNLSGVNVQAGQHVKTGQIIGKSAVNDDGQGEVDLMIMKESNNVNPEQWLIRK